MVVNVEFWRETFSYLRRHKHRTIMSSVGIMWGVFIMILLIGIGNGFELMISKMFSVFGKGVVYVYAGEVSRPTERYMPGAQIQFDFLLMDQVRTSFPEIERLSLEQSQWQVLRYENSSGIFQLKAVEASMGAMKQIALQEGRFLNDEDFAKNRNVVVLGPYVAEVLFKGQYPIGKLLWQGRDAYTVIGVMKKTASNMEDERSVYIPLTSYCTGMSKVQQFRNFVFQVRAGVDEVQVRNRLRKYLASKVGFDAQDEQAVYIQSMEEQTQIFDSFFSVLRAFLWFVSGSMMLGGILGIGNVMYASVLERTREIGIRKALGATARQIRHMVLGEALLITSGSAIVGVLTSFGLLQLVELFVPENGPFQFHPYVDVLSAVSAVAVLALAGILTGLRPASYAARIQPIDALRTGE